MALADVSIWAVLIAYVHYLVPIIAGMTDV